MPTPIGHSLAGAIIYTATTKERYLLKSWKWLVVCVVFAALADIDFAPALFGKLDLANRVHRHLTHTLLFAIASGAAAFGVLKILRRPQAARDSLVLFLCLASHILLDMLGKDTRPPFGVPFLWPFVGRSFKLPVELFPDLHKSTYAEIFSLHNMGVVAYEVMVFGSILSILIVIKRRRESKKRRVKEYGSVADVPRDESP